MPTTAEETVQTGAFAPKDAQVIVPLTQEDRDRVEAIAERDGVSKAAVMRAMFSLSVGELEAGTVRVARGD